MPRTETIEEYLARGGKITHLPYFPPNRDDPAFSHYWQTVPSGHIVTPDGEELRGFQLVEQ